MFTSLLVFCNYLDHSHFQCLLTLHILLSSLFCWKWKLVKSCLRFSFSKKINIEVVGKFEQSSISLIVVSYLLQLYCLKFFWFLMLNDWIVQRESDNISARLFFMEFIMLCNRSLKWIRLMVKVHKKVVQWFC